MRNSSKWNEFENKNVNVQFLRKQDFMFNLHLNFKDIWIGKQNTSAVKLLIVINRIKIKVFSHMCACTVYIYYAHIHTCMYIFKKNVY